MTKPKTTDSSSQWLMFKAEDPLSQALKKEVSSVEKVCLSCFPVLRSMSYSPVPELSIMKE